MVMSARASLTQNVLVGQQESNPHWHRPPVAVDLSAPALQGVDHPPSCQRTEGWIALPTTNDTGYHVSATRFVADNLCTQIVLLEVSVLLCGSTS